MTTSLHYLVHFIHPEFLEIHYYSTKFKVQNLNSEMKRNIYRYYTRIRLCPPEESFTQRLLLKLHLQQGEINPEYTMYSQDLSDY